MIYEFIFCFLKDDGSVETDEYGVELYHREEVYSNRVTEATRQFYKRFENKPEIIEIIRR